MSVIARPPEPVENRLLAALPADEYERLRPRLQQVSFSLGEVVYEFGGHLDYVFFPTNSIVSLLYTMENGTSAEMGLTGNDGVVGIALFMGGGTMPNRAVVQSAGEALRMKAKVLQDEFARVTRPAARVGDELSRQPREIGPRVHVIPRGKPYRAESQHAGPPESFLEYGRRAPGYAVEELRVRAPEADEVIAPILARPHHEVVFPGGGQRHRSVEELDGKRRGVAIDQDRRLTTVGKESGED